MAYDAQIHILDGQNDVILDFITAKNIIDDTHKKSLEDTLETYEFITLADKRFSQHLEKRNRIIIPDEDETLREFVIFEAAKYRDTEGYKAQVFSHASYLELKKARILYPTRREGLTASQHAGWALNDTGWTVGIVEAEGTRTFTIENHTNPYEFLKRIANEFEVELRFRIEHDGQRITGRYVDLLERIGEWRGREIEFGEDLDGIRRIEKQDIVTALLGLGPEREDGTRIEVLVEDEEALQRWGRIDEYGNLHHLIEPYEIQSERTEMTEEEARQYTRTALNKRINTQVTYETTIVDLENVPGMENKKIRFGDTIKIKDTKFNPPLYLEARVFEMERSIKNKAKKDIKLGDYIEYTEEEINAIWNQLRNEIRRRLDRMAIVTINSTAGNVFKNAQGETELTARTFVGGAERDEQGTLYDYQWMRFDKDGNHDTNFYAEGKTITVKASDIDEKATYRVLVAYELEVINTAEITISNVFDGEDGEQGPPGPPGEDGKTFYTWIKYADTPTSGMSDNPEGKEYIGIAYNKETPTPSTNYADYTWSKFKGEQGIPGPPGEDGQPTYTWVKYADDENGNGMSDSPEGKLYIGLAFNKTTPEESNNPADYTWSLMPQNIEIGGRNLLTGTKDELTYVNVGGWADYQDNNTNHTDLVNILQPGETYTLRVFLDARNSDYPVCAMIRLPNETTPYRDFRGNWIEAGKQGYSTVTFVMPSDATSSRIFMVRFNQSNTPTQNVGYGKAKLERGDKATDWTPAPEDVQEQIDEAKQEAEEAKQTADGKNSVFTQSTAPSIEGRKIGDVWFDTSRDNIMHRFDGTQWVEAKWGERSLAAESVTALHIKSLEGLNVNDQFVVDSQGNVKFSGHLEGASGTFSGRIEGAEIEGAGIFGGYMEVEGPNGFTRISDNIFNRYDLSGGRTRTALLQGGIVRVSENNQSVVYESSGLAFYNENTARGAVRFDYSSENLSIWANGDVSIKSYNNSIIADGNLIVQGSKIEKPLGNLRIQSITGYAALASEFDRIYLQTGGDEVRVTDWLSSVTLKPIKAKEFRTDSGALGRIITENVNGGRMYVQANGDVSATKYQSGTLVPMRASDFSSGSLAEYKTDIIPWRESALDLINNSVIYDYMLKADVEVGKYRRRQGLVIGNGYKTPQALIHGDAISQYQMNSWSWKAIQELSDIADEFKAEINALKKRIEDLEKEKIE